jgi:hypothetical protein
MKIFSLETKKLLVWWSLGFGFILNYIIIRVTEDSTCSAGSFFRCLDQLRVGWPIEYYNPKFFNTYPDELWKLVAFLSVNLIFWILISLVVLSLVRRWKYRRTLQ